MKSLPKMAIVRPAKNEMERIEIKDEFLRDKRDYKRARYGDYPNRFSGIVFEENLEKEGEE